MIVWAAKVLAHVGELAVIQVPGGLLTIWDSRALLIDGDRTTVAVYPADQTPEQQAFSPFLLSPTFGSFTNGQYALLRSQQNAITPLLLQRGETLPSQLILAIGTQPAEMDEGTPAGTGLTPEQSAPIPCGCPPVPQPACS